MDRSDAKDANNGEGEYEALNGGPSSGGQGQDGGFWSKLFGHNRGRPAGRWVPEEEAPFLSRLTFWWVGSLIALGNRKALVAQDLWDVAKPDSTETISAVIGQAWAAERGKPNPSLARVLWRCFGLQFSLAGALKLCHDLLQFASPVFLRLIVEFLQDPSAPRSQGLLLPVLLLGCNLLQSLCIQNYFHKVYRSSIHVRASIISLVYQKSLRISSTARQTTSIGQIVNLQSNDAEKLAGLCIYLHILWSGPLQIFGALGLLFAVIGVVPALCGFLMMLLIMPISAVLMRCLTQVRKRLILATDARVKLVSEIINGIKAIKLYAWEEPFRRRMDSLRGAEMKEVRTTALLGSFAFFMYYLTPLLVSLGALGTYALLGQPLTAAVAFPALALFDLIRFPLFMIVNQISSFAQAGVAFSRIEKFLELPETVPGESLPGAPPGSAEISDGSFRWTSGEEEAAAEDTLRGINLKVTPGQLLIVIGEVGSGKSSLLAALLGEIQKTGGAAFLNGRVAYTAQDPWIQNATLRDNILMGRPLDRAEYERVLDACALREDLKTLPGGDLAEIGEKGINLSGGQKHRVALARAVYCDADLFLLDDPLSAVDTHVGRHLFDQCICGELKGKTRVLVTHQLQYVEAADAIAVLRNGTIEAYGTFEELSAQGIDFAVFQEKEDGKADALDTDAATAGALTGGADVAADLAAQGQAIPPPADARPATLRSPASENTAPAVQPSVAQSNGTPEGGADSEATPLLAGKEDGTKAPGEEDGGGGRGGEGKGSRRITKQEFRAVGKVRGSVYMAYFRSWGPGFLIPVLVLLGFTLAQAAKLGNDTWLAVWTEGVKSSGASVNFYLGVYCLTAFTSALTAYLRNLLLVVAGLNAARSLHRQLLERTLRLPMAFFDSQPSGRLVNRFTRDTEQVDLNLPDTMLSFLICTFQVIFAIGIIVYVTPLFVFPLLPVLFVYHSVQRFYIAASRELKRLDSVARSPIFAHFGETVQGLPTIRAFNRQEAFARMNHERVDESTRAYFASIASNRWLGMCLEMLGALAVFATAFFSVWLHNPNAGFAGLALTNALSITSFMNWMVRMNAELETQMNSVERVLEYASHEAEAPAVIESNRPPPQWPTRGAIDAYNLVVRYRADLEPVLRNLSFSILGGEKVGVCGRTGCGKSTLMMTIYRIMELDSGVLLIDGLDVSTIGLYDLRSKLALVPQDPVVFSGTVRLNLDPFAEASGDDELWESLRRAGMAAVVESLPGKLDAEVAEGGSNFSTGQRQLLCMARALLRRTRILVLDEATSNVDSATDAIIQSTIQDAFQHCTVLTIAHRLHTIIDSDRVMLLDKGQLAEFDSPAVLLSDDSSRFTGFVNQTLPKEAAALRRAASSQRTLSKGSLLE